MALDVGTLVANLKLDRRDFDRGVTESEGAFSKLGGALAAGAKRLAMVGGAAIAAGGAVGLSTAARMEQASIAFTTMLGSGEKAKVFLSDLSAFAAKTPFEFPELQTAASSLISAGVEAGKVIPIMTTLGDVTSGMGTGSEGVKRATIALQQMNAAGRITGEDLNQLRDAGIPVYDLLASATGKSKEEVVKLAQAGKLGKTELDAMMGALESGKGLEKFTGLMAAQSQSLTGMWSTLKDTFSVGMATAIAPLIPLIKEGMGGAITFVGNNIPKLATGLAFVAAVGKQAFDILFRGDYKGGPLGAEDSTAVARLFAIREGFIQVAGIARQAFDILFRGDFRGGPLAEDSATVDRLFRLREGFIQVAGIAKQAYDILFRGDFRGGPLAEDSKAVDVLFRIREGLGQVKAAITDAFASRGGSVDFAAALDKAAAAAQNMWPHIVAAGQSVKGLEPVVTVTGAVFGFLADHIDTIIRYMPLMLAAFVAYKAAQAAGNVVALASLPVQAATVVGNLAAASANRALATAITQQTLIQNANVVTTASGTVATIAHAVASVAASAAAKTMAAAQWLLNAAMTANPIGLVIAAIALLVGGFVLAWKHSETFRNVVVGALNGVKDVTATVVGFMVEKWFWFADKVLAAAEFAFGWIPGIGGKVAVARAGMAAVAGAIQGEIEKLKGKDIVLDVKANGSYTMVSRLDGPAGTGRAMRATGGAVFGPGTSTSDSIPAMLSDGEHVWTAAEVAALGGHQAMLQLRGAVRRGEVAAFATGGAVGTVASPGVAQVAPTQYGAAERAALARIATETAQKAEAARQAAVAAQSAGGAPGGGVAGRGNVDAELLRRFDAWNASIGGGLRIVSGYRSSARQAQLYAAYLNGSGNLAARPGTSNHEKSPARAIDYGPANWARTATSYRFGLAAPVRSEPWHLERAFDGGGVAYGTGMMPKFTSAPERVLSPRQTEAFDRLVDVLDRGIGGGAPSVQVFIDGREIDSAVVRRLDGVADSLVYGRA